MRGRMAVLFGISLVLLTLAGAALAGGRPLDTDLSGAEEAPDPGDPNGTGTAALTLNAGRQDVCYELTWQNVDGTVFAAHVHQGPPGVAGPIVVTLFSGETFSGTGSASGCDTGDATREEIRGILQDPSGYYVNIHSVPTFPNGAIRGQLGD
jgi:hypothetical protein